MPVKKPHAVRADVPINNKSHGETQIRRKQRFLQINLTVGREYKERVFALADKNLSRQTDVEEIKIGSTTYVVNGYFAARGVTVSEKIKRLLDKETKRKTC